LALELGRLLPQRALAECKLDVHNPKHMIFSGISLSASPDAIDAAIYTKDAVVTDFADRSGLPLAQIAGIGDGENDIPFLAVPGLAISAAPLNAQDTVKSLIKTLPNGVVLRSESTKAFLEFYELAKSRRVSHIFADRDGVFDWEDGSRGTDEVFRVFRNMGLDGNPIVLVLTGSSYEQNVSFIEKLRIKEAVHDNAVARKNPFVVLAENGALQIDVLTLKTRDYRQVLDADLLRLLKTSFEKQVIARLKETVLPRFHLELSDRRENQIEKVYIPPKRTMLTINVPKWFRDGSAFRRSKVGQEFREVVLDTMQAVARTLGTPYRLLANRTPD
jgi:hypothetical protein